MISPCYGCDLQILAAVCSWYCFAWDILMITLNVYGLISQARKRNIMAKERFHANFVPESGNTIDLAELEAVREKVEAPRSRLWGVFGLCLSLLDLIFSVVFIQGVNSHDATYVLYFCVFHTFISYIAIIMMISAVKCNIRIESQEKPLGFNIWNVFYMAVDLYILWVGVSFMGGIKNGFEEKIDAD